MPGCAPARPTPEAEWDACAAAIAGRPRVRVSRDGGRTYPARYERALTHELPPTPAAVLLYNPAGAARCLAADFDITRGGQAQVDRDAAAFIALITSCGGRSFADRGPSGGRHVYVLWARPIPISDLRPVVRALCTLYPSLDPTPMLNPTAGCIRPPGARHRSGGHQQLTTPQGEARAAIANPNRAEVWAQLLDRLAPQLRALDEIPAQNDSHPGTPPALPRRRLPARITRIAETGVYDTARYPSPSEARQAVITAAAAAGWTLPDVTGHLAAGTWPGLAAFYTRYRPAARRDALDRDWRKATTHIHREKNDRKSPTREWTHTGAPTSNHTARSPQTAAPLASAEEYHWVRAWWNATRALERTGRWSDRGGLSVRLVLRALGAMAQMRGSRHLDIGRRGLALACGLDDSTVAAVLRRLRAEDDPVIDLLEADRGERGDLYSLRIPDAALEAAAWRTWRPGRIGLHPVFRGLGAPAALVYEALTAGQTLARRDVITDAALPSHTVDDALRLLAEHGLAERDATGWRRGPADPDRLARCLGIPAIIDELIERYRRERTAWRAYLDARDQMRRGTPADPNEPLRWQPLLAPPVPRSPDDDDYDLQLAVLTSDLDSIESAIDLLQRELGATVLARSG